MYIYIYIYAYICIYTYIHTHMHAYIHTCIIHREALGLGAEGPVARGRRPAAQRREADFRYVCVCVYIDMYRKRERCVCIYIYLYLYPCITYVCIYIYIYIYRLKLALTSGTSFARWGLPLAPPPPRRGIQGKGERGQLTPTTSPNSCRTTVGARARHSLRAYRRPEGAPCRSQSSHTQEREPQEEDQEWQE